MRTKTPAAQHVRSVFFVRQFKQIGWEAFPMLFVYRENAFHCFSLQLPARHALFSFDYIFLFRNDLFRTFLCTGIG